MNTFRKIFSAFTRKERVIFFFALATSMASGLALTGLAFANLTHAIPAAGGEYTEGFIGQPVYINPVTAGSDVDKSIVRLVFSNLSSVADKIDVSDDGRIWRIRLKENLRWQDGEKLTSDDVIFTVQKIQDPESSSPLFKSWQGVAVRRMSEIEMQIRLVNPYAFLGDTIRNLYILPKHLFADIPAANWRLSKYNLAPMGNGPYKIAARETKPNGFIDSYKLEAWDGYFGDKPNIRSINFRFFSQTQNLIKEFNSGQVDGVAGLNPQNMAEINRPHETISYYLPNYYAAFLNQSKSLSLQDKAVRQALELATDKNDILEKSLGERGRIIYGPIAEEILGRDYPTMDDNNGLELASNTLSEAGWKLTEEGAREKSVKNAKISLNIDLTVPQVDFLIKTAEALKERWGKIGFRINLVERPVEEITQNLIKNRDYQMLLFGNAPGSASDLFPFWHSSERFYPGLNLSLYNNKKADSLLESIRQDMNEESRTSKLRELEGLIQNDIPAIFLYSPEYTLVIGNGLKGADGGLMSESSDRFSYATKWYLKTTRVLRED
ncbi:MAG: ABC transporter substrate-binding protein [Patescibacteria group bacterium]